MNKLSIEQLDKLIESELTNIKSISNNTDNDELDLSSIVNNDIGMPVNTYLDSEDKNEKDKIVYFNKLKSINTSSDSRRVADGNIKKSKDKLDRISKLKALLRNKQADLQKMQQTQKMKAKMAQQDKNNPENAIRQQISMGIQEMFNNMPDPDRYDAMPIMKRTTPFNKEELTEMTPPIQNPAVNNMNPGMPVQPKKKKIKVTFNSKTANPFQAEFTERGFLIGTTRLSFEIIETALSKNFSITLDNGSGLVLDAINMQKILKYKDSV